MNEIETNEGLGAPFSVQPNHEAVDALKTGRGKPTEIAGASEAQDSAIRLVPLLKEYFNKFSQTRDEAKQISERFVEEKLTHGVNLKREFDHLRSAFFRISPAAQSLIRTASQLVEHGKVESVTKIELALRNAELESVLQEVRDRVGKGP